MTRRPDLQPDPARSAAFLADIRRAAAAPRLHSLGGSGVLVRFRHTTLVIDPYLSNTLGDLSPDAPPGWRDRNAPPPVAAETLGNVDAVLITHGDGDHFDPPTLRALSAASPELRVVLPAVLRGAALELGLRPAQLIHPRTDVPLAIGDASVTAIPAAHVPPEYPQVQRDSQGGTDQVGYLLRLGALTLYHAGDGVVYPGLPERLIGVDIAVLPVNGRRWSPFQPLRLGNLTAQEAADLAGLCGIRTVIPVHHTLMGSSAGGLEEFLTYVRTRWPELEVPVLEPGQNWAARGDLTAGAS